MSSSGGGVVEAQRSRRGVPLLPELAGIKKASEGQQEQPEKRGRAGGGGGPKRSTGDWEKFAKDLKAGAERRAEDNEKTQVGEDLDNDAMMQATGATEFSE